LLGLDFDHLNNVQTLFDRLLKDDYFETQLLFRSPSGDGLKWVISVDADPSEHSNFFSAVANYVYKTYSVTVDKSGRDISRACFLPHDPDATSILRIIFQPVNGIAATIFPEVTFQLSTFHFHFEAGAVLTSFAHFFVAR